MEWDGELPWTQSVTGKLLLVNLLLRRRSFSVFKHSLAVRLWSVPDLHLTARELPAQTLNEIFYLNSDSWGALESSAPLSPFFSFYSLRAQTVISFKGRAQLLLHNFSLVDCVAAPVVHLDFLKFLQEDMRTATSGTIKTASEVVAFYLNDATESL